MKILGENFNVIDVFNVDMTVPDCFVLNKNKIGKGNGEAKLYVASKDTMRAFYGKEGFVAHCFLLKEDLKQYMNAVKSEYFKPIFDYRGKAEMKDLWKERMAKIEALDDIIFFDVYDQDQIAGPRGYVNSNDPGYKLIREISLPLISYISVLSVSPAPGTTYFYWKLFVDFDKLDPENALVFNYGKEKEEEVVIEKVPPKKDDEISRARVGQGKYREQLIEECIYCPITLITHPTLLIASHIKPWAHSNDKEKIDPKNGLLLSPLYDRLFDQGLITFTNDKHMRISIWLDERNRKRLDLVDNKRYDRLPFDEERLVYLDYHRSIIFKG